MHLSCIVFCPLTLGFPSSFVFSPLAESISSPSHLISQCPYSFPALSPTFLLLSLIVVQKCKCNVSVCLCLFVSVFVDIDCLA